MKTPHDEVHIQVRDPSPDVPAPDGHYLRFYSKRPHDHIHVQRSPNRSGPWQDLGILDARFLHIVLYGLGHTDEVPPTGTIDFSEYARRRRVAGG